MLLMSVLFLHIAMFSMQRYDNMFDYTRIDGQNNMF